MLHQNITLSFISREFARRRKELNTQKMCFMLTAAIDASKNRVGFHVDNSQIYPFTNIYFQM